MICSELEKEWMTTEEVSKYLRLSVSQVFNLTSAGTLPYYKLGRRNRYLREEIELFIQENKGGFRCLKKK